MSAADIFSKFRDLVHALVLILSVMLIVAISYDTFQNHNFLASTWYMKFQFWVCMVFIFDFFIDLIAAPRKGHYLLTHLFFLLISIPYLNIISSMNIELGAEAMFFVRFIPLMRGALALSIVFGYLSKNAVESLFMSYLVILLMIVYFCSIIFYQCEGAVNTQVNTYWTALWWTMTNMSTVGCSVQPVTVAGRIVQVVLPISGTIMFPLFTVYLTDYVKRHQTH